MTHGQGQVESLPLPVGAGQAVRHARIGRFPHWLRIVDSIHAQARSAWSLLANVLVVAGIGSSAGFDPHLAGVLGPLFLLGLYLRRRYSSPSTLETQGVLWQVSRITGPAAATALIGVLLSSPLAWSSTGALAFTGAAAVGIIGLRTLTWMGLLLARRSGLGLRRTLILGSGNAVDVVASKLHANPEAGLSPVRILHHEADARGRDFLELSEDLARIVEEDEIEHVVLAPAGTEDHILDSVHASRPLDAHFSMMPPLHDVFLAPGLVTQVSGLPLVSLGKLAQDRTALPGKRLFDVVFGSALLLLASPVIGIAAMAIWLEDRGPVFYRQRRVGQYGEPFRMLKLRSMIMGADRKIFQLRQLNVTDGLLFRVAQDPRVTRVGRVIRKLSIDELPQLWNVVRGDMSLVGPRPLAVEPEDFGPVDDKRHSVPPGITGYWQIAGGNSLSYEEMVKLDLAYIREWSLWLDAYLVLRTIPALLHRRDPA